jgi:hypothetical protein
MRLLAGFGHRGQGDARRRRRADQCAQTTKQLDDDLVRTLGKLRTERASTTTGCTAKRLAIQGFSWMLRGVEARLEITTNDSGNLEASVHDAKRADRDMRKGAGFLRAAGRALGVRIGRLNGF